MNADACKKGTYLDFSVVSPVLSSWGSKPGPRGELYHYSMRDIGSTVSGVKAVDDAKTLTQCRFTIGDYIDVAITHPNSQKRFDRFDQDRNNRGDRGGQKRRGGMGGGGDRRSKPF